MKLVHSYKTQKYDEVPQYAKCKFAYCIPVRDEIHIQHAPVRCRDFLCDTLSWNSGEIDLSDEEMGNVYGYDFKGDLAEDTVLGIYQPGRLEENLKILNDVEKVMGYTLTTVLHKENRWLVLCGDKKWKSTTIHISWYTQILRVLTYAKNLDSFSDLRDWLEYEELDDDRLINGFFKMPEVLKKLKVDKVCNALAGDMEAIHEYSGWRSVLVEYKSRFTHYGKAVDELIAA
jgi:hypothetical protein